MVIVCIGQRETNCELSSFASATLSLDIAKFRHDIWMDLVNGSGSGCLCGKCEAEGILRRFKVTRNDGRNARSRHFRPENHTQSFLDVSSSRQASPPNKY